MTSRSVVVEIVDASPTAVTVSLSTPDDGTFLLHWVVIDGESVLAENRLSSRPSADMLLPTALLPAMRMDASLRIRAELSPLLCSQVDAIQRLYRKWDRSLCHVEVKTDQREVTKGPFSMGVAAFFSGGVDSFFTALVHCHEQPTLVFVHGFDISAHRAVLLSRVSAALREAARALQLDLFEIATDVRKFSGRYLTWSEYHGAALAAAAHFTGVERMYVPSSLSTDCVRPYGSHPDLDPLYASISTEIKYDGFETSRVTKTLVVAGSDTALKYLRVCNARDDLGYNCGRCEKCLRTLVALRLAGIKDRPPSFPARLSLADLSSRRNIQIMDLWRENFVAAVDSGTDRPLIRALLGTVAWAV